MPLLMRFSDILHSRVQATVRLLRQRHPRVRLQAAATAASTRSRSTSSTTWSRSWCASARPSASASRPAPSPSCWPRLALLDSPDALLVSTATRTTSTSRRRCSSQKLGPLPDHRHRPLPRARPAAAGRRARLGIRPAHRRARQAHHQGAGKWMESTGDRSKFGLTATEIVLLLDQPARRRRCSTASSCCTSTSARRSSPSARSRTRCSEACRIYVELAAVGRRAQVPRRRRRPGRRLRRLADELALVHELHDAGVRQRRRRPRSWTPATTRGVPHPDIVSESGRALVAHHSVLVFNVLDVNEVLGRPGRRPTVGEDEHAGHPAAWSRPGAASRARTSRRPTTTRCSSRRRRPASSTSGCSTCAAAPASSSSSGAAARRSSRSSASSSTCPTTSRASRRAWPTPTSATSRCSSRCPTTGRSSSCSRSCRSTGSTSSPTRRGVLADLTCDSDGKIDRSSTCAT